MTDATTSRVRLPLPAIWREWGRFVRRPSLPPQREALEWPAVRDVACLLVLNIAISVALLALLVPLSQALAIETPEFEALTQRGWLFTLATGALAVPLMEELVARGWLAGRRRHLALAGVLIGAVLAIVAGRFAGIGGWPTTAIAASFAGLAVMVARRVPDEVPPWFARHFPALFYASAAVFSLAHLSNYDLSRPLVLIPFVIPQFVAALLFGFARVKFGMWANIALHSLSNALFLTLTLSGI